MYFKTFWAQEETRCWSTASWGSTSERQANRFLFNCSQTSGSR